MRIRDTEALQGAIVSTAPTLSSVLDGITTSYGIFEAPNAATGTFTTLPASFGPLTMDVGTNQAAPSYTTVDGVSAIDFDSVADGGVSVEGTLGALRTYTIGYRWYIPDDFTVTGHIGSTSDANRALSISAGTYTGGRQLDVDVRFNAENQRINFEQPFIGWHTILITGDDVSTDIYVDGNVLNVGAGVYSAGMSGWHFGHTFNLGSRAIRGALTSAYFGQGRVTMGGQDANAIIAFLERRV